MLMIKLTSVMVEDQTRALAFYTDVLGFEKVMDFPVGEYRWITVAAPGRSDLQLAIEPNVNGLEFQRAMFAKSIPLAAFQTGSARAVSPSPPRRRWRDRSSWRCCPTPSAI